MNKLNEMSFKSDLYGTSDHVNTITIITPENPRAIAATPQQNNAYKADFERELNKKDRTKVTYRKVIGQYGSRENSYLITNLSLDEVKNLAALFQQQSFIFGVADETKRADVANRGSVMTFEFWQTSIQDLTPDAVITPDAYYKADEVDRLVYDADASDFFTKKRNFKFNLPFPMFN